jgi:glycosyltransferase involved in cell wall biosynthesis
MHIAFYAPMKPPDHPVPSGDRRMAQLLIRAFRHAGHRVSLASRLRSYDGTGDAVAQRRVRAAGRSLAKRYAARRRDDPPDLWFTYHCYHKAPDHLGPGVADSLGIPYVIADASVAPKQAHGPWADGYVAANTAIRRADRVIAFDPLDIPCVAALRNGRSGIVVLPPVVDGCSTATRAAARHDLAQALGLDPAVPWLVATAMMRPGAKCCSYRLLAAALRRIAGQSWALLVAGDGTARPEVEGYFAGIEPVRFLGALDAPAIRQLHAAADLAVWPAIDEAYCMAIVEAQAAGLPVVAGARPGIAAVVDDGKTGLLTPVGDLDAFADAVRSLLDDPARRETMAGAAARSAQRFDLSVAARRLDDVLASVGRRM